MSKGWVGVDLDGTLAHYDGWKGADHIGEPVPLMLWRVKAWLELDVDVRIVTARVANGPEQIAVIEAWCKRHIGRRLPVTDQKDFAMLELWDDRVVAVEPNTGRPLSRSRVGLP